MIKPTLGYKCADGTMWASVADFQRAELVHIIRGESKADAILDLIVANAERIGEVFSQESRKMTPTHIILWHAPSSCYVICAASKSRGVTIYRMQSQNAYEYEADAQRHIDTLASGGAESYSKSPTPPVSGTAGV